MLFIIKFVIMNQIKFISSEHNTIKITKEKDAEVYC